MSGKINHDDLALFREAASGSRRLHQDTITPPRRKPTRTPVTAIPAPGAEPTDSRPRSAHFSDQFEPYLQENNTRYETSAEARQRLRSFKRENFEPQMIADLHGFNLKGAHNELDAFIAHCARQGLHYVCVIHGKGEGILQRQVPLWLAQHSEVLAFDKAGKGWGGDSALVILLDSEEYGDIRD